MNGGKFLNSEASPITPQATLLPAFPVFLDSSFPPLPKSSSFSCTTTALPIIEYSPNKEHYLSVKAL